MHINEITTLDKKKIQKIKRITITIPVYDRCCALRSNKEQCTRKKKLNLNVCGTHEKNAPYGILNIDATKESDISQVWQQDIQGIIQYIDKYNNVYKPEDIKYNKPNPRIVANYECINGIYSIIIT